MDIVFQFVDVKYDGTFMLGIATRSFVMPNLEQGFLSLVWWRDGSCSSGTTYTLNVDGNGFER
jgi:hypothetical protein